MKLKADNIVWSSRGQNNNKRTVKQGVITFKDTISSRLIL